jgi:hypothetical protein
MSKNLLKQQVSNWSEGDSGSWVPVPDLLDGICGENSGSIYRGLV